MTRSAFSVVLLLCGGLLAVPGCDKTTGVAPIRDGKAECLSLSELCHGPGQELGGRYQDCHNIGHEGEGKACLREYEECRDLCEAAAHGHAGAGGEGGGHHAEAGTATH
jgi:hypothetical protein